MVAFSESLINLNDIWAAPKDFRLFLDSNQCLNEVCMCSDFWNSPNKLHAMTRFAYGRSYVSIHLEQLISHASQYQSAMPVISIRATTVYKTTLWYPLPGLSIM